MWKGGSVEDFELRLKVRIVADNARGWANSGVQYRSRLVDSANRVVAGLQDSAPIDAAGKHVVIIGGGDTGADCLGVAHRQGAANVVQLDQYPLPPDVRVNELHPWPTWPVILRRKPWSTVGR